MGQPFAPIFVDRFVGYCDSCGLSSKSWGVQSGRRSTICADCCEAITAIVNARAVSADLPKPGLVSAAEEEAAAESARASIRRSRRTAAAVA